MGGTGELVKIRRRFSFYMPRFARRIGQPNGR